MRHLIETLRSLLTTWPSMVVAIVAWVCVVAQIDPAGSYPLMPEGPGLTIDEVFNVQQGVYLTRYSQALGWYNLVPGTLIEAFQPKNRYNPDHPPLGRYWLGIHHQLTWMIAPPYKPKPTIPFVTACARTGSATAFALTAWLVGAMATIVSRNKNPSLPEIQETEGLPTDRDERSHSWVGFFASMALVLMPRAYGHAHLASLESITNLTCTGAVTVIAILWSGTASPGWRPAMLAGLVMGLAMLTKIQAILIPLPVIFWSLWRWRLKSVWPLMVWGCVAITVFFAGWPYLWLDPVGHFQEYLGRTTHRVTLYCYYFGQRYADKSVPWHYPFVMFAMTVPVAFHALGLFGWRSRNQDRSESSAAVWQKRLILGCMLFPLIVFACPGVAVYDGERLFLTVFPLWAIFVGLGVQPVFHLVKQRAGQRFATIAMVLLFGYQLAWQRSVSPTWLCYYNELTLGNYGAEKLGMELDYWGCSVTRSFLENVSGSLSRTGCLAIAPTLHSAQDVEYERQSPILREQQITIGPADWPTCAVIVFRRRADLPDLQSGPLANRVSVVATFPAASLKNKGSVWLAFAVLAEGSHTAEPRHLEDLRYP